MSNYTPPTGGSNYMDWGTGSYQTRDTANKIDSVAGKAQIVAEMLETALLGFDSIEKELVDLSQAQQMPSREQIRAFAYRIDTNQNQLRAGLEKIKQLMNEVDQATNTIQRNNNTW